MKRRDLFKTIGTLVVGAVCAPLAKAFEPVAQKPIDWSMNPIAKASNHLKPPFVAPGRVWRADQEIVFGRGRGTLTCVAYDSFAEPLFHVGERVMINDVPHTITETGPGEQP